MTIWQILIWAAVGLTAWVAVSAIVGVWLGRVARNRDQQIPRGWHRYDRTCACAACERCEPSSPYLKVGSGS